jgi:hypothetical protein
MLTAIHFIRQAIITRLTGTVLLNSVAVPVFNRVPSSSSFPYIYVYSLASTETDFNADSFIEETRTRIEIVTRFQGDSGGELQANLAISQILNLIRTRSAGYFDLSADGFNVFTCVNEGVQYLTDEDADYTYFRAILEVSNKIQQLNNGD